jgi:hypothetical protein
MPRRQCKAIMMPARQPCTATAKQLQTLDYALYPGGASGAGPGSPRSVENIHMSSGAGLSLLMAARRMVPSSTKPHLSSTLAEAGFLQNH